MGRTIAAVVAGYVAIFIVVFILFSVAYLLLGVDGSFQPGSYEVSGAWIVTSFVLSFVAALAGGRLCHAIGHGQGPVKILAGVVLVLGFLVAVPALFGPDAAAVATRPADVGVMEAMMNARTPGWIALLNPIVGAIGVLVGGRGRQESAISAAVA